MTNRKQLVQMNGCRFCQYIATPGVTQGSNLGLLVLKIVINDISDVIDSYYLLYADDLKLFSSVCQRLADNLKTVVHWYVDDHLSLNVPKCEVMTDTFKSNYNNSDSLVNSDMSQPANTMVDLGGNFDKSLLNSYWYILSSALRAYGFIMSNRKDFGNTRTLKIVYYKFVRTKLEYVFIVWSPNYQIHVD